MDKTVVCFRSRTVLFMQQDRVIVFNFTAVDAPYGGGVGVQVGTATGAINGTSVVNFKFTFTSIPTSLPLTFTFDNRVGITDTDGDQIIFRNVGTGKFDVPLLDPTLGSGDPPYQVFGNGVGGPLTGTYEVIATKGKYVNLYPLHKVFPYRAISYNPNQVAGTPPWATTGSSYVEVLDGK